MQSNRCGNYVLETELLVVSGAPVVMQVPIRRCLLAERMLIQIVQTEPGREVAAKLTLALTNASGATILTNAGASESPLLRAALGPDLEPIHHTECQASRCLHSCTPGYFAMLQQFGLPSASEEEIQRGCRETGELPEQAF